MIKELIKEILKEELTTTKPQQPVASSANVSPYLGKKCMIRTYSAGVHFGTVKSHDKKEVTLANAYRVYYWKGAATLSQLAMEGSKNRSECKITMPVDEIYLSEAIEIIPMSDSAYKNLAEGELWKM